MSSPVPAWGRGLDVGFGLDTGFEPRAGFGLVVEPGTAAGPGASGRLSADTPAAAPSCFDWGVSTGSALAPRVEVAGGIRVGG